MNWKAVILGGLAYYATAFVVSMAGGVFIHEGILDESPSGCKCFVRGLFFLGLGGIFVDLLTYIDEGAIFNLVVIVLQLALDVFN